MLTILEGHLWVSLEDRLDLLGPVNDGSFKENSLVLARGSGTGSYIIGWQR